MTFKTHNIFLALCQDKFILSQIVLNLNICATFRDYTTQIPIPITGKNNHFSNTFLPVAISTAFA